MLKTNISPEDFPFLTNDEFIKIFEGMLQVMHGNFRFSSYISIRFHFFYNYNAYFCILRKEIKQNET